MAIQLSEDFAIESNVYANQGNSCIGIRGSGKTHTATKTAEDLMSDGVPIVVFDPSGVWHNLRYGKGDKPGFPIVVAGGAKPDLELTELNAIKILEAAMKENVSIIFDLSEVESKAKEIKIVADCIEYIMQFNKTLRHIFIEEAAEYCPQKLNPGLFKVYSQLERMARIGRNKGLGFTLINQRSQEIAKAIFEALHSQTTVGSSGLLTTEAFNSFISSFYGGSFCTNHITEPTGSVTTKERLMITNYNSPNIEDCYYRMLNEMEIKLAMAFDRDYKILGSIKNQVKQCGNAVTPPVVEWLTDMCIQSLN